MPAFRSLNVGELCIKDKEWVYFNREGNLLNSKSIVQAGDVLVIRSGAPGLACVVTPEFAGYNVIDLIIAHPDKAIINSIFLAAFTNFGSGRNQISRMIGGAAQKHINVGRYKSLILKLPPKNLQDQFANFIQQLDKSKYRGLRSLVSMEELYHLL